MFNIADFYTPSIKLISQSILKKWYAHKYNVLSYMIKYTIKLFITAKYYDVLYELLFNFKAINFSYNKHATSQLLISTKYRNLRFTIKNNQRIIHLSGGFLLHSYNNDKKFKIKNIPSYPQIIKYLTKFLGFSTIKISHISLNGPRISAFSYILKGFVDYPFSKILMTSFKLKNNIPCLWRRHIRAIKKRLKKRLIKNELFKL